MVTPRKMLVTALVLGAGLSGASSGCSGENTDSFDSQTLTRVDDAGADGDCQNGGVKISTGLDKNKNGVLEDDEIDPKDVKVVCAGNMMATGEKPKLRRTDMLKKGDATCSAGGVAIHTGIDDNSDKKLEDNEIDETQYICNSHPVVTRTTALPVGDANCPFGGKEVAAGIDDGAKPDNGKLEDDEVDTTYFDCNANPPSPAPGIEPPAGDPGTSVINLTGGTAMGGGYGGQGGALRMNQRDGSDCPPAITQVFPTGTVDASFKVPTFALDFGPEKFEITDKIALELSTAVTPVNGTYYATPDGYIARWNGAGFVNITGLRIAAGASLTLPAGAVGINVTNDLEIQGTLNNTGGDAASLSLGANVIVVGGKGVVEFAQTGAPGTLTINASSSMSLQGQIHAQGINAGGAGATVTITSLGRLYLGGSINATGGAAPAASGGSGGSVSASARLGGVWSTADIDVSGGDGLNGAGIGGNIHLGATADSEGGTEATDLRSSGKLKANGGSFTACPGNECTAGGGGSIDLRSLGADLLITGALDASAGAGTVNIAQGGQVLFSVMTLNGSQPANVHIATSANITALGGSGNAAGDSGSTGGTVSFENCAGQDSSMQFLGYSKVLLTGGAGGDTGGGGSGGAIVMNVINTDTKDPRFYLYTPVDARGSAGYSGGFGGGMILELRTAATPTLPVEIPSVVIAGKQLFSGGKAGVGGGGNGGTLRIHALGSVELRDSLDLSASPSDGDDAGSGGQLDLISQLGNATNGALLSANGASAGVAGATGGYGGCIAIEGREVNIDKNIAAHGGDSMGTGSVGGNGGTISLMSHDAAAAVTGKLDVAGGKAETAGAAGQAGNDIAHCVRRG